ncbi:CHC2 zinc finger domain-containing protein [Haliangium ochraceum]|uniref:DNA primase catalytic core domain protein n=1 Tax=Haliangium ochraceum (strain DSM 14365 / JCM 11303 / SMP-2) TaxID=502025 RepID=D0LLP6_HALO1|nr:CHC2 zinc finger domain-containing protein [Haliangium ochraceum]ACY13263.1 DNA primase catalytic core domain protein [Haliangium ochraceum DSM 14365]
MQDSAFRSLIEQVRERTDLVSLVGETISLAPSGSVFKGSSPWTRDATPSLVVWPHTRTWRDFSAGGSLGGDCFDWLQQRDGVPFLGALQQLAVRSGVEVPGGDAPALDAEIARIAERRRVEALLTAAASYYHSVLPTKIRSAWYRERYGFTDATVDDLLLGWANGQLYEHFVDLFGVTQEEALATGLFIRCKTGRIVDFFQDRLVFPYWKHGRVVYFIGRATELTGDEPWEQAKYKKLLTRSERHPYVSQHIANETFYNEDAARARDTLMITEGVTDCISAMQAGVPCISPVTVRFRKSDHDKLIALTERCGEIIICNDAEDSGVGEAGAIETAHALQRAGRDVVLARIPRPPGTEKIDVNEVVTRQGPEALRTILGAAKPLPLYLLEGIPTETPKTALRKQLGPTLEALQNADPLTREACSDELRTRFRLKAATINALLRQAEQTAKPNAGAGIDAEDEFESVKGQVYEDDAYYYTAARGQRRTVLSSFRIVPLRRITLADDELVDADVLSECGRVYRNVRFPRDAWNSKHALQRVIRGLDLRWMGSDENLQGVLSLVAAREVPMLTGTTNLGYAETEAGPRWVTPDGELTPEGPTKKPAYIYISSGATLHTRTRYAPTPAEQLAQLAERILPSLFDLNTAEVILPILGWFFATPLKPRVQAHLGHFPVLFVWGSPGSGKTSLLTQVFWPLLGVVSAAPYSATETEFALIKLLSATDSVPVFIDEYKPADMQKNRRNTLHRYMRRIYTGDDEERGRADQTLTSYRLSAPLCLAGETRPTETALVERVLAVNPDKNTLQREARYTQAFQRVRDADPTKLSASIIQFLLGRDTETDIEIARARIEHALSDREVPLRIRDNLLVMTLGLHCFGAYADSLGVEIPEIPVEDVLPAMLEDLLDGSENVAVKSGFDRFIEELSIMAIAGTLEHGRHYVYQNDSLALHFGSCHAAYCEHARRTGYEGEVVDRQAMRRLIKEHQHRDSYVRDVNVRVCFNGRSDRRRAVLIDIEKAKAILDVDDFPVTSSDSR